MLNRVATTTVAAAALGALIASALLLTRVPADPAVATTLSDSTSTIALTPAGGQLLAAAPQWRDFDMEMASSTMADAWGDGEPTVEPVERRLVSLGRGGTLIQLLLEADVPRQQAHEAVAAMGRVHSPRQLRQGQEFTVLFDRTGQEPRFMGFEFQPAVERIVSVTADEKGFNAAEIKKPLTRESFGARATITSSLYQAGAEAGVPTPILAALIRTYSYDVDFQRDIKEGDGFEVLFDRYVTEDGVVARDGGIRYAALKLGGKVLPIYRFDFPDGTSDFFNRKGESVRKALLRTPIDGARISSSFGMRTHPVLGYSKMHKGVDFAAPTGTPIFAAGDGVVEEAGVVGAYGNYVRIRHNGKIQTAYAHMSRFGKNIRRGARVSQGDVIGFVGSTGRSTGPHLHFEVIENGRQVNPQKANLPTGRTLDAKEQARFQALVAQIDAEFARHIAVAQAGKAADGVALASGTPADSVKPDACSRSPGC